MDTEVQHTLRNVAIITASDTPLSFCIDRQGTHIGITLRLQLSGTLSAMLLA